MIQNLNLQIGVNGNWKPLGETKMGVKLSVKRIKPIREKIIDALIKRGQLVSGRSKIYYSVFF